MTQPNDGEVLNTDDPTKPGNLSAAEYMEQWAQRAAELGDSGLHIIPAKYLEGRNGEDR